MRHLSLCTLLGALSPVVFVLGCGEDKPVDTAASEVEDTSVADTNDTNDTGSSDTAASDTGVDSDSGETNQDTDTGTSDTGTDTDTGDTDNLDTGSTTGPGANAVPDFLLADINPNSSTLGQNISPRDYLQQISGWYFIKST